MTVHTRDEQALSDLPDTVTDRLVARTMPGRVQTLYDRDGVMWSVTPIPYRLHRCRTHTVLITRTERGTIYRDERCRCGAQRIVTVTGTTIDRPRWRQRNSRPRGLNLL